MIWRRRRGAPAERIGSLAFAGPSDPHSEGARKSQGDAGPSRTRELQADRAGPGGGARLRRGRLRGRADSLGGGRRRADAGSGRGCPCRPGAPRHPQGCERQAEGRLPNARSAPDPGTPDWPEGALRTAPGSGDRLARVRGSRASRGVLDRDRGRSGAPESEARGPAPICTAGCRRVAATMPRM
jgi:hypothetical protein